MDRRILKTRQDIREAFITLLKVKTFEEMTVKDLAEVANINRATFYKHYEDKHDLLASIEQMIIDKTEQLIKASSPVNLTVEAKKQPAYHTIVDIYRYLEEERALIEVLISANGHQSFLTHMQYLLEQLLKQHFKQVKQRSEASVPLDIVIVYLASAHLGVIKYWLLKKLTYTPEEMAYMLLMLIKDGPVKAAHIQID